MIAVVCNCSGYKLKEEILKYLEEKEIAHKDFGTYNEEILDDPEAIKEACKCIQKKMRLRHFHFWKRLWNGNDC